MLVATGCTAVPDAFICADDATCQAGGLAAHPDAPLCEDFEGPVAELKFTPFTGSRYEVVEEGAHRSRRAFKLALPAIAVGSYSVSAILRPGLHETFAQPSFWLRWSCFVMRVDKSPLEGTTLTGSDVGRGRSRRWCGRRRRSSRWPATSDPERISLSAL